MNWFKKIKQATSHTLETKDRLHTLVRTMEDDRSGRQTPIETLPKQDPVVTFRPNTVSGAPFFAAPGVVETPEPLLESNRVSPFLKNREHQSDQEESTEEPVFDPPLEKHSPLMPVSQTMSPPAQSEYIATSVRLNTAPKSVLPDFQSSLTSLSRIIQGFTPLFQDRKIRIAALLAAALLVTIIFSGLYLWWQAYQKRLSVEPDVRVESPNVPGITAKNEALSQSKYLSEQPNILSFDTETVTAEQIKETFRQVGQTVQRDHLPGAIEFLVRDQKLNPLAFSRFAYLLKLGLPAELLGTLDEPFSLYIFIDNDRPRATLLVYIKDPPIFEAELKKNEKGLATALEPLFLDTTTAHKANVAFRDGQYLERPVRYANIDPTLGLSVDYAVRGKQWIIGTSKDSLRSVLDKTGL